MTLPDLTQEVTQRQQEVMVYHGKLEALWNLIETPAAERTAFLQQVGVSVTNETMAAVSTKFTIVQSFVVFLISLVTME